MSDYSPFNWHWIVAGDEPKYWSSAVGDYVTQLPDDAGVTRIASEAELNDVLKPYGVRGPLVRPADVHAERDRRLAAGFDYDFGDERGVHHHIATTPGDMIGWQHVTTWATVQAVTGKPAASLNIKTETGPTTITATDWFAVLNAATAFRQPIWGASFVLEAMDAIPINFREDRYWPAVSPA